MSVYFARVKGYVKIGYSKNPDYRLNTITAGNCLKPEDIKYGDRVHLLGTLDGDRALEREMHDHFSDLHVVGEWFLDDDSYDELIAEQGTPGYDTTGKTGDALRFTEFFANQAAEDRAFWRAQRAAA